MRILLLGMLSQVIFQHVFQKRNMPTSINQVILLLYIYLKMGSTTLV